jgi:hypothetical protein
MSEKTGLPPEHPEELKEYAGGWMTERKGTDVPGFLKLAFPVIGVFCLIYLVVYMNGEINHADRGVLVQQFNAVTQSSSGLIYAVVALGIAFVGILVSFVMRKFKED